MARKSRRVSQRQYRARLAKYEKWKSSSLEDKSFKEWNASYRQNKFLRRQFKLYQKKYDERLESSTFGFRTDVRKNGFRPEAKIENFKTFKEAYLQKRNDLQEEVDLGERERVGSVINRIIDDQAYEISRKKAKAISKYLLSEERELLISKGFITFTVDENGKQIENVKAKRLELLIRKGEFVREEVGLWDMIKADYEDYKAMGLKTSEIRDLIGETYFDSDRSRRK